MGIRNLEQEEAAQEAAFQRKRKIVYIPPERMIALLNHAYREAGELPQGEIVVMKTPAIPDTSIVGGIYFDNSRRAFVFIVLDESFPEVPDGETCEVIKPDWQAVKVALEPKKAAGGSSIIIDPSAASTKKS